MICTTKEVKAYSQTNHRIPFAPCFPRLVHTKSTLPGFIHFHGPTNYDVSISYSANSDVAALQSDGVIDRC